MKIEHFSIDRFKSLVDFKIDFTDTTILYGLNNVGKSNVLKALQLIFTRKRKANEDGTFSDPENFFEGTISDFENNYYNNKYSEIPFEIKLSAKASELNFDSAINTLKKAGDKYAFALTGRFVKYGNGENVAEIILEKVTLGHTEIFSKNRETNEVSYFISLDTNRTNQGPLASAFSNLVSFLNDCVYVIGSERIIRKTSFTGNATENFALTPDNFKQGLFNLSLNSSQYKTFENIDTLFNSEPFKFGSIQFAKDRRNDLEIMIKDGDLRLPLGDLGSGVSQLLYVIATISTSKSKIICIEELEQNLSPTLQQKSLHKIQGLISQGVFDQLILSSHSGAYANANFGTIYYLEKDGYTKIGSVDKANKRADAKMNKKVVEHLKPSFVAQVGYTPEEWEQNLKEIEERLRSYHDLR